MKLASIINVWVDAIELLPFCIENHLQFCDHVIVVWSMKSNHGNYDDSTLSFILKYKSNPRVTFHQLEPTQGLKPLANETRKRNHGIDVAIKSGFTHCLIADQDEFWDHEIMNVVKSRFNENSQIGGFVHPLKVFIKSPTLWCEDHTLVPGIQKLTNGFCVGSFKEYPFAYDGKGNARIDPSRRPNTLSGICWSPAPMAHMSYVRKNIDLKIDNSSANLRRSRQVIYDELRNAKPGYISKLYHKPLEECPNYFNLPLWEY